MGNSNSSPGIQDPCNVSEPPARRINLSDVEARVDKVSIDGLQRTKDDVVSNTVKELFRAKNFQEVIQYAHGVRKKLEDLGCFKNIGVFIDTSNGQGASPNGVEVVFQVKEQSRVIGGISTMVGNNEGSLVIGLRGPNLMGRGERIQLEYSYGSRRTNNLYLSFVKPLTEHNAEFTSSIFQRGSDWPWSGYSLVERGLLFDIAFQSACMVRHNLQYELAWRETGVPGKEVSFTVREDAGHTLKSALRHILTLDRRNALIFPTEGIMFRWTTELAGIGGDVGFLKNDAYIQVNVPLPSDIVLQATAQLGFIQMLFEDKTFGVEDKFFIGGPLNVRGFEMRGLGPRSDGNSVGANAAWGAGIHLYAPLPFKPDKETFLDLMRLHGFMNFGLCNDFPFTDDYAENARIMFRGYRMSYGAGLALRLGQMARVELNYVIPQIYEESDAIKPGFQFGVGLHFL